MRRPASLALLALACQQHADALPVTRSLLQQVSIDFGWRHFLGNPPLPQSKCAEDAFPQNRSGVECVGLKASASGDATPQLCRDSCCSDPSCETWQWTPHDSKANCWIGSPDNCSNKSPAWLGGQRNVSNAVPQPAAVHYNDSLWDIVDTPHDFLITGKYTEIGPEVSNSQGNLPKNVSWYRKHFTIPSNWKEKHIDLYIEASYSVSTYYLNGKLLGTHSNGYTSAIFRLDDQDLVHGGGDNILAIFVDATMAACTGWWYEGGGLARHSYLLATNPLHFAPHGLFTSTLSVGPYNYRPHTGDGVSVANATLQPTATIVLPSSPSTGHNFSVNFRLYDATGTRLVANASVDASAGASSSVGVEASRARAKEEAANGEPASVTVEAAMWVADAECWTVARPHLYVLVAEIVTCDGKVKTVADTVNSTVGVRDIAWDGEHGLRLNEQQVKMRGFCNHESFAGIGMALPDRVQLFRIQASRGVGGNSWRASHNPPSPSLLDLADVMGLLVLDENRVFSAGAQFTQNMADLVARDRHHASVIWWSFCNEPGCNNNDRSAPTQPTLDFKLTTYRVDGTRAVTGNMCVNWGTCPLEEQFLTGDNNNMSLLLDVQGLSHPKLEYMINYHARWPNKPLVATECCSCLTQRGEDDDITPPVPTPARGKDNNTIFWSSFNADCLADQVQRSDGLDYVGGSFVWTLFDYIGEPNGWPHVSSSFGSFDLAGFPKPAVWWYRSWWLANIPVSDAGRPAIEASATNADTDANAVVAATSANSPVATSVFVRVVELCQDNPKVQGSKRTVHVYTNARFAQLLVEQEGNKRQMATNSDGTNVTAVPVFGYATFTVDFVEGRTVSWTAHALAPDSKTVLASHTAYSWGKAAALIFAQDVPSETTGTGSLLYLDGQDAALLRVTVVDANGRAVQSGEGSATVVTFSVVSGPGTIWATGNGDPSDHVPAHSAFRPTYHGLSRVVVRATVDGSGTAQERVLRRVVNSDAGKKAGTSAIIEAAVVGTPEPVVVKACAAGLGCVTHTVRTSYNQEDSVLGVAKRSIRKAYIGD